MWRALLLLYYSAGASLCKYMAMYIEVYYRFTTAWASDREDARKWEVTGKVERYGETEIPERTIQGDKRGERESGGRGGRQICNEEKSRPRTGLSDIEKGRKDTGTGRQREGRRVGGHRATESTRVRERTRKDRETERQREREKG